MNIKIAKYIRVRCSYCGKVVRSNGKGELIYPHNRRVTDEVKAYMKLYTIGADSSKVIKMQRKAPAFRRGECQLSYQRPGLCLRSSSRRPM